mmetsp:Transcript_5651/g.9458  ORF Transcript_5651/g.9458 Transcript_5651/m.9458 type:complete len:86 (-) Transcript_5651:484-741(-)
MRSLTSLIVDRDATAKAKIANLDLAPTEPHEDVGRLQIPVDDVPAMKTHQAKEYLRREAADLLICQHNALGVHKCVQVAVHQLEG